MKKWKKTSLGVMEEAVMNLKLKVEVKKKKRVSEGTLRGKKKGGENKKEV